jgi:hypothetical protein
MEALVVDSEEPSSLSHSHGLPVDFNSVVIALVFGVNPKQLRIFSQISSQP